MFDIGTRILLARRKRGLRQGEVAKLAGISQKQMSQIETGKRPGVQAVTIAKIAQVLHVSTDYLLGLKEEENWEQAGKMSEHYHTLQPL
jgi:transcriptional regulator with XRE-family HTH domain